MKNEDKGPSQCGAQKIKCQDESHVFLSKQTYLHFGLARSNIIHDKEVKFKWPCKNYTALTKYYFMDLLLLCHMLLLKSNGSYGNHLGHTQLDGKTSL